MVFYSYQCGQFKQDFSPLSNIFKILCMLYAVYAFTSVTVPATCSCQVLCWWWGIHSSSPVSRSFLAMPVSHIFALRPCGLSFSGQWMTDVF